MFDLRFVEREAPDWPRDVVIGEPRKMKTIKILQFRYQEPTATHGEFHDDFTSWSDWEDVRTEEE